MILTVLGAVKNHVDVGRAVILQGYIVITHHPVMVRPASRMQASKMMRAKRRAEWNERARGRLTISSRPSHAVEGIVAATWQRGAEARSVFGRKSGRRRVPDRRNDNTASSSQARGPTHLRFRTKLATGCEKKSKSQHAHHPPRRIMIPASPACRSSQTAGACWAAAQGASARAQAPAAARPC